VFNRIGVGLNSSVRDYLIKHLPDRRSAIRCKEKSYEVQVQPTTK